MEVDSLSDPSPAGGSRCPHCNVDMRAYSEAHRQKHMSRCKDNACRRMCTGRPVGRPAKRKPIKTPPKG